MMLLSIYNFTKRGKNMDTGTRLKWTREDKDLTQKEVANMLDITQQSVNRYENNQVEMKISVLTKFCCLYGVSADYILGLPKGLKYIER